MSKSSFPRITWMPFGDSNRDKRRYDDSGRPFNVSGLSVPTPNVRWEVSYFSGSFQCRPFDATTGAPHPNVIAGATLYAQEPRNRSPQQVGSIAGSHGTLSRGHALCIDCGAGVLHVSWDFDEYKHPKID